jgi:pimeloyl-ACP methyl ester carboxylesterase
LDEGVPAELVPYYQQQIDWRDCADGFQCGTLRVPNDYSAPGAAGDLALQVVRLPSEGSQRIGSLIVNPGGPGASGVDYARAARSIVGDKVRDAYDIVGFDPRGVAGSEPVDCLDDDGIDALLAVDPTPDDAAEVQHLIATTATMGEGCLARSPQIVGRMDTVSTAKDLDVLRAVLGDEQLHFLGKSFGTAIGAVYAEQFPAKVGRLVLDGAFPVSMDSQQISLGQAQGFESALRRFVADCQGQRDCPLQAGDVDGGVAEIGRFLSSLEEEPLAAGEGRQLTEALGSAAILYHLYFPASDWALLRQGLAAAFDSDGSVLLGMLDDRLQRDAATGVYANNAQEAFYAVSCLDRPASPLAEIEQRADLWAAQAPTFGPSLAWGDAVCAQWPVPPVSAPRSIAAAGAAPILVVSTQYDPATPYQWGVVMAQEFDAAALVSFNGDGHTAYRRAGSACVDEAVEAYLLRGILPAADPRCGY